MTDKNRSLFWILPLFVVLLVITRLPFIIARAPSLPGDESVFGLMVMDVLKGARPIYYYGQSYMGTVEVYLAALVGAFWGVNGFTLQFASLFFYVLFVLTQFLAVRRLWGQASAFLSSLFLIFSPVMLWELSTKVLGAYSSLLFFASLSLLLWLKVFMDGKRRYLFPLGFTLGFGLYLNSLFLMFFIPVVVVSAFWHEDFASRARYLNPLRFFLLRDFPLSFWAKAPFILVHCFVALFLLKHFVVFLTGGWDLKFLGFDFASPPFQIVRLKKLLWLLGADVALVSLFSFGAKRLIAFLRKIAPVLLGFLVGYLPAIYYKLAGFPGYRIFHKSRALYFHELISGLGDYWGGLLPRSAWGISFRSGDMVSIQWAAGIVAALILIAAFISYIWSLKDEFRNAFTYQKGFSSPGVLFPVVLVFTVASAEISSLKADRYFIFLVWSNVVMAGWFLWRLAGRHVGWAVLMTFILVGAMSISAYDYLAHYPKDSPRRLIQLLDEENIQGGYASYDTAYQLAFYTEGRLRFEPLAGMRRIPAYDAFVKELVRKAYVFEKGDDYLSEARGLGLGSKPHEVREAGRFVVYLVDKNPK